VNQSNKDRRDSSFIDTSASGGTFFIAIHKGDDMKNILILFMLVSATLVALCPSSTFALGAIAVADNGGKGQPVFAIVIGYDYAEKASKAALDNCMSSGGANCKVVLNFERCGSVATSNTSYGVGGGVDGRIARNLSLRNCGEGCRVAGNECETY